MGDLAGHAPTPAEAAWRALVEDRGHEPSPHEAFLAGFDAGFEQAAVNPPPPEGPGGY